MSTFQSSTCSTCPHVYLLNCNYSVRGFGTKLMGRVEYSEWCTCHKSPREGQRHQPPQISAPPLFRVPCPCAPHNSNHPQYTSTGSPKEGQPSYYGACSSLHYIPTKRGKICEKSTRTSPRSLICTMMDRGGLCRSRCSALEWISSYLQ